jgi:hypothetical protein
MLHNSSKFIIFKITFKINFQKNCISILKTTTFSYQSFFSPQSLLRKVTILNKIPDTVPLDTMDLGYNTFFPISSWDLLYS